MIRHKPKCVKGTACGYACISGKKLCSDKVKARDAAELLKATGATKADKSSIDTESVEVYTGAYEQLSRSASKDVPPDTLSTEVKVVEGASLEMSFKVNGEYKDGTASKGNELKVAMAAMRDLQTQVKDMPDGVLLRNAPYKGDDKFESRVKLYKKAGFGDREDSTGEQYGMVYKGKIYPLTLSQFTKRGLENPNFKDW